MGCYMAFDQVPIPAGLEARNIFTLLTAALDCL